MSVAAAGASSSSQQHEPAVQAVLEALDALYNNPDKGAKQAANRWLQDFQKTSEAWQTANSLLLSQTLPVEPRLFAAQTFRIKTTFDLDQIPRETLPSLRATLLTALQAYKQGPRVIQTQLCITLAGLALQLRNGEDPEWGDHVVKWMIERFGSDPNDVKLLLEFLTVLPEEITGNQRIPVSNDHYNERTVVLLADSAEDVVRVLNLYAQAQGITADIQNAILSCLASWLHSGEVSVSSLSGTPLFNMAFESLADLQLFDVAVDVLCDIIHETQEVDDNQEAIQLIVPRLVPLRSPLKQAIDDGDDDMVRGLCRVLVQAGETYHRLILRHKDTFIGIVQAIYDCVQYSDLEIVQITFRFWSILARDVRDHSRDPECAPFLQLYQQLLDAIVKHLRFPEDLEKATGQARDDFKSFRHYMGDTLKDCCQVLGSQACLARSLAMIQDVSAKGAGGGAPVQWQDLEAPLFSMRAMGAEADPRDNEVLPQIMDLIPGLPSHPRLTYAALLVIARYTEWVQCHPDRIPSILSIISAGLTTGDADVAAAAAQAFHYLGRDCCKGLQPFLPQLKDFYSTVTDRLDPEDVMSVSDAIAYVIASLPARDAVQPLIEFTQPLLAHLASIGSQAGATSEKAVARQAADRMQQIERFMYVASSTLGEEHLPSSCAQTCEEAYGIIDAILAKFGTTYFISERACALLRRSMAFFGDLALPTLPRLVMRLVDCFEKTGYPAYIWIVGKSVDRYGEDNQRKPNPAHGQVEEALAQAFERISTQVLRMLDNSASPADIPDVLDDYLHTCSAMASRIPQRLLSSPTFPQTLRVAVSATEHMYQIDIVTEALNYISILTSSDMLGGGQELAAPGQPAPHPHAAQFAQAIRAALQEQGAALCTAILRGIVSTFDAETTVVAATVIRMLVAYMDAASMQSWLARAMNAIDDPSLVPVQDKQRCLQALQNALANSSPKNVRPALQALHGASRRMRERARVDAVPNLLEGE